MFTDVDDVISSAVNHRLIGQFLDSCNKLILLVLVVKRSRYTPVYHAVNKTAIYCLDIVTVI